MSGVRVPKPYYLPQDQWDMLVGNRLWEETDKGWEELHDPARPMLSSRGGGMDVKMYLQTEGPWLAQGGPTILVTAIGRKSGEKRTISTNYMPYGGSMIVVGSWAGLPWPPQWALNLDNNPQAWVKLKDREWEVKARKLISEEKTKVWPAMTSLFPLWQYFQKFSQREFMLFSLDPVG
ncbi:MAG TPA: nitroreductase family deazaflavin-dependent oxidoreductase [Dehalococcoidia bacterium]|nr:nitroreductase family deazaflavin-dependent oxidoreductase [Dehalococcoidia bacterium]